MYSWSFLCEEAKFKQHIFSKQFVKSARKQYGNPDSHALFISETGWSITAKFFAMKCETVFNLTKKFGWNAEKYLFTVMENIGQFFA